MIDPYFLNLGHGSRLWFCVNCYTNIHILQIDYMRSHVGAVTDRRQAVAMITNRPNWRSAHDGDPERHHAKGGGVGLETVGTAE